MECEFFELNTTIDYNFQHWYRRCKASKILIKKIINNIQILVQLGVIIFLVNTFYNFNVNNHVSKQHGVPGAFDLKAHLFGFMLFWLLKLGTFHVVVRNYRRYDPIKATRILRRLSSEDYLVLFGSFVLSFMIYQ